MAYICAMEFEWDDAKSDACFTHRGFDFSHTLRAFLDPNRKEVLHYEHNALED